MGKGKLPVPLAVMATTFFLSVTALGGQSRVIKIVAAENFYGNIAEQIGGDLVNVTSIMSDPKVDTREYVSSAENVKAIAEADLVVENGGGFDPWMDTLLSASPAKSRVVLKGLELAVKRLPHNEYVWYDVNNMQAIATWIARSLERLRPQSAAKFLENSQTFQNSLDPIREKMALITEHYTNTPVGLIEAIFLYQTVSLGLKVLTPLELPKAVAARKNPPPNAVREMENQIREKKIRILIYNDQAPSTIEAKVQADAKAAMIPIVGLTETMPPGETYQTWMLRQLDELRSALIYDGL